MNERSQQRWLHEVFKAGEIMKLSRPLSPGRLSTIALIRRELCLMIVAGLMISLLIAWATVGLFDAVFLLRFCYASMGIVSLNIIAYLVKVARHSIS
ncbi:hypothetical protein [Martelella alba]|uniref:Uncharacterized protein n=1 Tax=Martelella alba TaxID=2590451 RepID=A0ABY2SGL3_9HYPH|nr:hypothetical protein [Martelella alba]TKI04306.1 hypothetical protein FCN80_18360 [Martelella alba]